MNTANITDALKPTVKTAPFQILLGGILGAVILPIFYPWLCNLTLPAPDALRSKDLFYSNAQSVLPWVIGGGGGGAILGSLFKTGGKVAAQLAPGVVTEATPNGEGLGFNPVEFDGISESADEIQSAAVIEQEAQNAGN